MNWKQVAEIENDEISRIEHGTNIRCKTFISELPRIKSIKENTYNPGFTNIKVFCGLKDTNKEQEDRTKK